MEGHMIAVRVSSLMVGSVLLLGACARDTDDADTGAVPAEIDTRLPEMHRSMMKNMNM